MALRFQFNEVFEIKDGELDIKKKIRIAGITVEPMEIGGTNLGGIDWSLFNGNDLHVTVDEDTIVITGIFKK